MSRILTSFIALVFTLASCQEEKAGTGEEVTIVRIPAAQAGKTIDWNYEFALINSEAVRKKAASALNVDPAHLKAVRIEADITNQQIRIIGPHGEAFATACKSVRLDVQLSKLEDHLQNQTGELGSDIPANSEEDPDQMTYEKALQALEKEPADDGIIYRKTPEE